MRRKEIANQILAAWAQEKKAQLAIENITTLLHNEFDVESKDSKIRFLSAKPPR